MNIYVANIDKKMTEKDLKHIFSECGRVGSVTIWFDRETGKSAGYGFVKMPDAFEALLAVTKISHRSWNGKRLRVSIARSQRGESTILRAY
jgi:RNA recognition motif-containing protein